MSLTPVDEAIDRLLSDASPSREELIAIQNVNGRILSQDLTSRRTPGF
jgi:molybdopterin biosynthesis enzyme